MVKKNEDAFTRFHRIHERDRRTDRQTDTARRHRPRLGIVSKGKKSIVFVLFFIHSFRVKTAIIVLRHTIC